MDEAPRAPELLLAPIAAAPDEDAMPCAQVPWGGKCAPDEEAPF